MMANLGAPDRAIRLLLGLVCVALPFLAPSEVLSAGWGRIGLWVGGAVFILTALVRFCPLYALLGLRTRKD